MYGLEIPYYYNGEEIDAAIYNFLRDVMTDSRYSRKYLECDEEDFVVLVERIFHQHHIEHVVADPDDILDRFVRVGLEVRADLQD